MWVFDDRLGPHAWKACIRETVSGVRIPLSPPGFSFAVSTPEYYLRSSLRPLSGLSSDLTWSVDTAFSVIPSDA